MSKLCPKCGQIVEDDVKVCPFCNNDIAEQEEPEKKIEDILEVPTLTETIVETETPIHVESASTEESTDLLTVEPLSEDVLRPLAVEPVDEAVEEVDSVLPVESEEESDSSDEGSVIEPIVEISTKNVEEVPTVEEATETIESPVEEIVEIETPTEKLTETVEEVQPVEEEVTEVVENPVEEIVEIETPAEELTETVEEVPTVEEEVTETIESPVEEIVEIETPTEETTEAVEEVKPVLPGDIEEKENKEESDSEDDGTEVVVAAPVVIATADDSIEVNALEEIEVNSDNFSLDVVDEEVEVEPTISLEEEKVEEEVIEMPPLPEPTIGEINPDILTNKYNEEEDHNNKMIELKEKQEQDRKRREQEEREKQLLEKPDLLATSSKKEGNNQEYNPKKKKAKHFFKLVSFGIVVFIVAVIVIFVYYLFINPIDTSRKDGYMTPVEDYYEAYNKADLDKMKAVYVPCMSKSDEFTSEIATIIGDRKKYIDFDMKFEKTTIEVVGDEDKASVDETIVYYCANKKPKIEDYKHVYVKEKTKTNESKDYVENKNSPHFWVVKVDGKWYIAAIEQSKSKGK